MIFTDDDSSFHSANDSLNISTDDSFGSPINGLGDSVRQCFNLRSNNILNVCHINAQSIASHYDELLETFTNTNVHAILVSESWLKPHLLSTSYSLPGFILIRNDRIDKRGGGVAIYLRSDLPFKTIASSCSNYSGSVEFLFLELWVKGAKAVVGVVYCPPSVDYFTDLELVLESLGSDYKHHIIMGDFNTDLLSHYSPRSRKFYNIIESVNLHVLPLQATHHNINGNDTWLDVILISDSSLVSAHGQYPASGFSLHDLIFLSYILKPPKAQPKVLHVRSFAKLDVDMLRKDALKIDWMPLTVANSVDKMVEILNNAVTDLYDVHAPIKRIKIKRPPAPWITKTIRLAMSRRNQAFHKYKSERSEVNWSNFKSARNRCNQMVRNAKRRHILNNISFSSPADVWKFLGTLGIGKTRQTDIPRTIGLDDINRYFSTSDSLDSQTKSQTLEYIADLPSLNIDPFHFSSVAANEIKKIILSIKSNALGYDNISRRMIITILDQLLSPITHLINFSLSSCQFPSSWSKAFVRPLPKTPNPTLLEHFRPISILPFLSKVLEVCVHKQLANFIHNNNILSQLQSGFRPGHSTTTALLKVTGDIRAGVEDTKATVLVLIDFSNAFNAVNHEILLSILSYLKISTEALGWFSSYLRGRQQSVRIDDNSSTWCDLSCGVPQGGILSPLLFSLFINLITTELHCAYHLYADDLQIYSQSRVEVLSESINNVNRDLRAIADWSARFGLSVNPTKCQAVIIGGSRMISRISITDLPPIMFNGTTIPISRHVKDLGLHIDSVLDWKTQVTNVSQKVTGILRSLYRLKNFLSTKTKVMLVQTLIFPIIDYGDVCYLDLNADLLNKLDRLLNNCIRFVFNLRKYDHVSTFRSQLHWLPIRERRRLRTLTTLFSILHSSLAPSYLTPLFPYLCSQHNLNLRSSNNNLLLCPSHSTGLVHSSFSVQSILLWNELPLEIRMSTNRYKFKAAVRRLLSETTVAESTL